MTLQREITQLASTLGGRSNALAEHVPGCGTCAATYSTDRDWIHREFCPVGRDLAAHWRRADVAYHDALLKLEDADG